MYHYAGNNPIRYIDPDGRADSPSWKKIPEKCEETTYTETMINPQTRTINYYTYHRKVDHFRISFTGKTADNKTISFSGTKDKISISNNSGLVSTSVDATLIRLNVKYDGKSYDYYELQTKYSTRFLFFVDNTPADKAIQVLLDLSVDEESDKQSLYNGNFNRDVIEDELFQNSIIKLLSAGLATSISADNILLQSLVNTIIATTQEAAEKQYNNQGSNEVKREIQYFLPEDN